jgi:ankyrin repeat protein
MTPLIRATKRGDLVEVRRLLSSGADPNESSSGWTPIHMAAARGNTPILSLLLSAGAKPDSRAVQIAAFGNHACASGGRHRRRCHWRNTPVECLGMVRIYH